jgi:hypothetical protein
LHYGKNIFPGGETIVEISERHKQILGWKGGLLEVKDIVNVDMDTRRIIKEKI